MFDVIYIIIILISIGLLIYKWYSSNIEIRELESKCNVDMYTIKEQNKNLTTENTKLKSTLNQSDTRLKLLNKNMIGIFDKSSISNKENNKCVSIAQNTKGDNILLQLDKNCTDSKIFTYDPNYKQVTTNYRDQTKCIDTFNETDIVLSDCIKNSQKQKFNYYPLLDNKLHSVLYSKCLSYNTDTNIIQLESCDKDTNLIINNLAKEVLYITN